MPLHPDDSIPVVRGTVEEAGLLSDSEGRVFLEFPAGLSVVTHREKTFFDGEILPPEVIRLPGRAPRARMREFLSFELIPSVAADLNFVNRFYLMSSKEKMRHEFLRPESLVKTPVRVVAPVAEEVGRLALWEFLPGEEEKWFRLGGVTEDSVETGVRIFLSSVRGTGVYTIFDEDPPASFVPPFPIDQIQLAEPSPFVEGMEEDFGTPNPTPDFEVPAIQNESDENVSRENSQDLEQEEDFEVPAIQNESVSGEITPEQMQFLTEAATSGEEIPGDFSFPDELMPENSDSSGASADSVNLQASSFESGKLPVAGAEKSAFPVWILVAVGILGASAWFGFRRG